MKIIYDRLELTLSITRLRDELDEENIFFILMIKDAKRIADIGKGIKTDALTGWQLGAIPVKYF